MGASFTLEERAFRERRVVYSGPDSLLPHTSIIFLSHFLYPPFMSSFIPYYIRCQSFFWGMCVFIIIPSTWFKFFDFFFLFFTSHIIPARRRFNSPSSSDFILVLLSYIFIFC